MNNKPKKQNGWNLARRFALTLSVGLVVLFAIAITITTITEKQAISSMIDNSRDSLNDAFESQIQDQKQALQNSVKQVATLLSQIAPDPILSMEVSTLEDFGSTAAKTDSINYVIFYNEENTVIAAAGDKEVQSEVLTNELIVDGENVGKMEIGFTYDEIEQYRSTANKVNRKRIKEMREEGTKTSNDLMLMQIVNMSVVAIAVSILCILLFRKMVSNRLLKMEKRFKNIASGDNDLTKRIAVHGSDGIDRLGLHFNEFVDGIHSVFQELIDATKKVSGASENVKEISNQANKGVKKQQNELDQVATAINEMSSTVQEVAKNASFAATGAKEADKATTDGKLILTSTMTSIDQLAEAVNQAAEVIRRLQEESDNIGVFVDVIRGIAEQTNLLALNAAIEAARAGEQGRGFAVVADEVRTLANRTQESTQEIQVIIERLQKGASEAMNVMDEGSGRAGETVEQANKANDSLNIINEMVSNITDLNIQIASAAEEQTSAVEEINKNVVAISDVSYQTAEGAQQTAASSQELATLSQTLSSITARYRT